LEGCLKKLEISPDTSFQIKSNSLAAGLEPATKGLQIRKSMYTHRFIALNEHSHEF
jgi:hypothetical protein